MRAILSNRIYLSYTDELMENIRKHLTYKLPPSRPRAQPIIYTDFHRVKNSIVIPIGRTDLIPEDYEITDRRVVAPDTIKPLLYDLRESQLEAVNLIEDNYIINAIPGYGKTVTALGLAHKLQQKTLIIVHTLALREQWEREAKKILGEEVGIIGSGKFKTDAPIVVANVQSLYKRANELINMFGVVIVDEVHHTPSKTFKTLIDKFKAKYKIGLSGTLTRKDGRHRYMLDYFGGNDKVFKPAEENVLTPEVSVIHTDFKLSSNLAIPWATRVNDLIFQPDVAIIISEIAKIQAKKGHKVLVVSDRVEFLENLQQITGDNSLCVTGSYKDRKDLENRINNDIDIIYGSISIFKEGISINALSCLVLATPINNDSMLTQLIGRIQRKAENKLKPEIIDVAFKGGVARRQLANRYSLYSAKGYKIR